ncbi:MAG: hypothetical protein COV52_08845 [Gammaproteobacteria bacterium CG11_big_fil_rev_8_21_14_0_20_46_22]|nr:MAG: hypothetical protein COW05_01460 [Gammaproteobacteria bacterium CG12_big_fil_rev_8_21_14_0_65_46_12]PIR10387.1 MAG: hypothetical protein COV52_08845 [Gammaproteobacteria bacterium CG11_big_fil_rev_8_21_14_0_20_46_22]
MKTGPYDRYYDVILRQHTVPLPAMMVLAPSAIDEPMAINCEDHFEVGGAIFRALYPVSCQPIELLELEVLPQSLRFHCRSTAHSETCLTAFDMMIRASPELAYPCLDALLHRRADSDSDEAGQLIDCTLRSSLSGGRLLPSSVCLASPWVWLRELFLFPEKDLCLTLTLNPIMVSPGEAFSVSVRFSEPLPELLLSLSVKDFLFNAFAVANHFIKVPEMAEADSGDVCFPLRFLDEPGASRLSVLDVWDVCFSDEQGQVISNISPFCAPNISVGDQPVWILHHDTSVSEVAWCSELRLESFESFSGRVQMKALVTQPNVLFNPQRSFRVQHKPSQTIFTTCEVFRPLQRMWLADRLRFSLWYALAGWSILFSYGEHRERLLALLRCFLPGNKCCALDEGVVSFLMSPEHHRVDAASLSFCVAGFRARLVVNERVLGEDFVYRLALFLREFLFSSVLAMPVLCFELHYLGKSQLREWLADVSI